MRQSLVKYLQVTNKEPSDDPKKRIEYLKQGHCYMVLWGIFSFITGTSSIFLPGLLACLRNK